MPFFGDFENFEYKDARVVILPILLKEKKSYLKSKVYAAEGILHNSRNLTYYDIECGEIYKYAKFHVLKPEKPKPKENILRFLDRISEKISCFLRDKKFPIVICDSHLISLASSLALKKFCKNYTLINFDAHADLFEKLYGRYSCATVMRRIFEEGIHIVEVGIRAIELEEENFAKKNKIPLIYSQNLKQNLKSEIKKILKHIKNKEVYLSIDADFFNNEIMHSYFPEPQGLNFETFLQIAKQICKRKKVLGFDFVEHMPQSKNDVTSYFASWLIYKLSGLCLKH